MDAFKKKNEPTIIIGVAQHHTWIALPCACRPVLVGAYSISDFDFWIWKGWKKMKNFDERKKWKKRTWQNAELYRFHFTQPLHIYHVPLAVCWDVYNRVRHLKIIKITFKKAVQSSVKAGQKSVVAAILDCDEKNYIASNRLIERRSTSAIDVGNSYLTAWALSNKRRWIVGK